MKKLSIIVPVYNAEKWIQETLDSLCGQTYADKEILCVDDGSKDSSAEIVLSYAKKFPFVKLISQKNSGVCAARNNGIDNAEGEYIAFCDSDDYLELNAYEEMIAKLEEENSDICFCEFVRFWTDGHKQYTHEKSFEKLVRNPHDITYFLYSTPAETKDEHLYTNDIHGAVWRSVFKKTILNGNNIRFHTDLKFAEDQIFVLEYLYNVNSISYIDKHFVWYRGWTKEWVFRDLTENNLNLVKYQAGIVNNNSFYSKKQKKQLIGYLMCSAYFMSVNPVFSFLSDADVYMKKLYKEHKDLKKLLTVYNFAQKYKVKKEFKRIILFILLKLRMFKTVRRFYPVKRG